MMFFVMIKPHANAHNVADLDYGEAGREVLLKMMKKGILVGAYHRVDGGNVYIINADSFADVRNAFRDSDLSATNGCEIREIDQKSPLFLTE